MSCTPATHSVRREIAVGGVAAGLSLAGVVDQELGDFPQSSPFLAVVDDDPDPALLRGLDADFDAVNEIRAARADVRAEDIRSVAFVVDAAGDHRAWICKTLDLAKEIHRRAADRRQQDLEVGTGDQLGKHASCLLEQGTTEVRLGYPEARRYARQVPNRIDRGLGDAYLTAVEEHLSVGPEPALNQGRTKLRRGQPRLCDRDCRTHVDAGADMFGEDLPDEMTPRVDRYNFGRLGPLRLWHDPARRRCVGQIGAVVSRKRPRCNRECSVDRISAGI